MQQVFVASPGDVQRERQIVERLVHDVSLLAQVNSFLWEQIEFDIGSARKIQEYIARPSDAAENFTIVFCIFGERIGTPLPKDYPVPEEIRSFIAAHNSKHPEMPIITDGTDIGGIPLTGTLFELIDVLQAEQSGLRTQHLYVLRRAQANDSQEESWETDVADGKETEKEKHVRAVDGVFSTLLHGHSVRMYDSLAAFEGQVRSILDVRLPARTRRSNSLGQASSNAQLMHDNINLACRGLERFDRKHAPYFFGRNDFVESTLSALSAAHLQPDGPVPALLVTGSSGSGKSSVLNAGIAARLLDVEDRTAARLGLKFSEVLIVPDEEGLPSFASVLASLAIAFGVLRPLPDELAQLSWTNAEKALPDFTRWLDSCCEKGTETPLVVLDQFEELLGDGSPSQSIFAVHLASFLCQLAQQRRIWAVFSLTDNKETSSKSLKEYWDTRVVPALSLNGVAIMERRLESVADEYALSGILLNTANSIGIGVLPEAANQFGSSLSVLIDTHQSTNGTMPLVSMLVEKTLNNYAERIGNKSAKNTNRKLHPDDIADPQNLIEIKGEEAFEEISAELNSVSRARAVLGHLIRRFVTAVEYNDGDTQRTEFVLKAASLVGTHAEEDEIEAVRILCDYRLMHKAGVRSHKFTHRSVIASWPRLRQELERHASDIEANFRFRDYFARRETDSESPDSETVQKWSRLYRARGLEGAVLDTDAYRERQKWLSELMLEDALETGDPAAYAAYVEAAIKAKDDDLAADLLFNALKDNPRRRDTRHRFRDASDPIAVFNAKSTEGAGLAILAYENKLFRAFGLFQKYSTLLLRPDSSGNSLLHAVSMRGDVRYLPRLLKQAVRIDRKSDFQVRTIDRANQLGLTPLMLAAWNGKPHVVQALLESKAEPAIEIPSTRENFAGRTAVHFAASHGGELGVQSLSLLKKAGARLTDLSQRSELPIHCAASVGCDLTLRWLLNNSDIAPNVVATARAALERGVVADTALIKAVRANRLEAVQLLLEYSTGHPEEMSEALRIAAGLGFSGSVRILLPSLENPFSSKDSEDRSALHLAAQYGRNASLAELVKAPTIEDEINRPDMQGRTALHLACLFGRLECIRTLLQAGARVDLGDEYGRLPIEYAAYRGNGFAELELKGVHGDAVLGGAPFETLLQMQDEAGLFQRYGDDLRQWALSHSARTGRPVLADMLAKGLTRAFRLVGPAWHELEVPDWLRVLFAAMFGNHPKAVSTLFRGLSDEECRLLCSEPVNEYHQTAMHYAAEKGQTDNVGALLPYSDPFAKRTDGQPETPIHAAAYHGQLAVLELMHEAFGQELFQSTDEKGTLCASAAAGEAFHVLHWAARAGADLNRGDVLGRAPVHIVARKGQLEGIRRLHALGANMEISDMHGWKPIHLALREKQEDVFAYLYEHTSASEQTLEDIEREVDWLLSRWKDAKEARKEQEKLDAARSLARNNRLRAHQILENRLRQGDWSGAIELLQAGGDVFDNEFGPSILEMAIADCRPDILDVLCLYFPDILDRIDLGYGGSVYHVAVRHRSALAISYFHKLGASPDGVDLLGRAPLGLAAQMLDEDCVQLLIRITSDRQSQINALSQTPLHTVSRVHTSGKPDLARRKRRILRYLLKFGYRLDSPDLNGDTALDLLLRTSDLDVSELLFRERIGWLARFAKTLLFSMVDLFLLLMGMAVLYLVGST